MSIFSTVQACGSLRAHHGRGWKNIKPGRNRWDTGVSRRAAHHLCYPHVPLALYFSSAAAFAGHHMARIGIVLFISVHFRVGAPAAGERR